MATNDAAYILNAIGVDAVVAGATIARTIPMNIRSGMAACHDASGEVTLDASVDEPPGTKGQVAGMSRSITRRRSPAW